MILLTGILLCIVGLFQENDAQTFLPRIKADPVEHWFHDPAGRVRLFHGVNCVKKGFPWYKAEYMLNDTRLDHLEAWGLNVVRLGSMWSGAEPAEDQYNVTYINILQDIVQRLADRGIYTILDMHQDVLSSNYNAYDGIPKWLADKFPPPTNPYPWPLDDITQWEDGYFTQAASEGFQNFYDNSNNSLTKWTNFWGMLASNFTGNTNVFGYNLINEPWIGDYFSDFNLTYPGYAAQMNLVPSYDQANEAIREFDNEAMILYEPVFYGQLYEEPLRGSGFLEVPGGPQYQDVSAYSFHTYCWPLEFQEANATDEEIQEEADYCANVFLRQKFEAAVETVNRTGGGVMLTEFGLCKTYQDVVDLECDAFMRLADEFLMSWTEWDYSDEKFYGSDGDYIPGKVYYYARPYARAIAGTPTQMSLNTTTLEFYFEFVLDTDILLPTEIFVPDFHYSCGYEITVSANIVWEVSTKSDVIFVNPLPGATSGEVASFYLETGPFC